MCLRVWGGSRAPRKFVNQEHYGVWLSQLRYFGRNLGSDRDDNHARVLPRSPGQIKRTLMPRSAPSCRCQHAISPELGKDNRMRPACDSCSGPDAVPNWNRSGCSNSFYCSACISDPALATAERALLC